jgi:Ca-activated chloride channel family protein
MKLRNVLALTLVMTAAGSAAAFAVTPSAATVASAEQGAKTPPEAPKPPPLPPSRFQGAGTLAIDARLGHDSVAKDGTGETYLMATLTAAEAKSAAPPVNLALVIDKSGSMKGDRIARAIEGAVGIVERLRDGDMVTVVAFDTKADVVVTPTEIKAGNRAALTSKIRAIALGGDTCISCGLEKAMDALQSASISGPHTARMILLSDGVTNNGIKDVPGLRAMAGKMRDGGFTISTIGVDVDFDEKVMAAIANESNGKHYFVSDAAALPNVFAQELDGLLATVANDAEVELDLAPGVVVDQVFDRTFRREVDGTGVKVFVPMGTFAGKQEKTLLVKLRVPVDAAGALKVADVHLVYKDKDAGAEGNVSGALNVAIVPAELAQKDLDPFVAARVDKSLTASTLTEANLLFEQGRVDEARAALRGRSAALHANADKIASLGDESAKAELDSANIQQLAMLDRASTNFAPAAAAPPPMAVGATGGVGAGFGGGGIAATKARPMATATTAAPAKAARAQVRENQQAASDLGL